MGCGKAAEKQPEEQPKHPNNSCFDCFSGVLAVLPAVFSGQFFGCFQMSGIWHLSRWPQKLQNYFSQTFRAPPGISQRFFWDVLPESLFSLSFGGRAELFGPDPFMRKTRTPPEYVQNQKFEFVLGRAKVRDRKGTPKNFCDKDFAQLSGELSGAICLKTLFYWVVTR